MKIIIRKNAAAHEVTVETEEGTQRFDLAGLNNNQLAGVRELIVDNWAEAHGKETVYR